MDESVVDNRPTAGTRAAMIPASSRIRLARTSCRLAVFLMPACIIATPWGLEPFAGVLLLAMVLAPEQLWAARQRSRTLVAPLLLLAVLVAAVVLFSRSSANVPWSEADNRLRILAMPLFALALAALRPERAWFWAGAWVGLAAACAIALSQYLGGLPRPGGWTNPIGFAEVALGLMVIVAFCRPPARAAWVLFGLLAGVATIVMTGSRGVWPGLVIVAITAFATGAWRLQVPLRTWLLFASLVSILAWIATPLVATRIDALQRDAVRYEVGDFDTSLGARLDLLTVAGDAFLAHPWRGVGVGNFGSYLQASPICADSEPAFCRLGHAHSDLPEWAATMGIPGLLAIIALYGVPLVLFARERRRAARPSSSAATAGLLFVATFALCGLTQSMFAHQLVAAFYATMVGLLAGYCLLEREHELV